MDLVLWFEVRWGTKKGCKDKADAIMLRASITFDPDLREQVIQVQRQPTEAHTCPFGLLKEQQ